MSPMSRTNIRDFHDDDLDGIVRLYDLVVAQTSGGPGIASEVPAKYVYDSLFLRQNLRQGLAGSAGSDFHDPAVPWNPPGRFAKLAEGITPVTERLDDA